MAWECGKCGETMSFVYVQCTSCEADKPKVAIKKSGSESKLNPVNTVEAKQRESVTAKPIQRLDENKTFERRIKEVISNSNLKKADDLALQFRTVEAKSKGYEAPFCSMSSLPMLNIYQEIEIPISNVSERKVTAIRKTLMYCELTGESHQEIYKKVSKLLTKDFEWREFDYYLNEFKNIGIWPAMWYKIGRYFYIKDDAPVEELLYLSTKEELLDISREYPVKLFKSNKKDVMVNKLLEVIHDRDEVAIIYLDMFIEEKIRLLIHTLSSMAYGYRRYLDIKDSTYYDKAQIAYIDDTCPICKKMSAKTFTKDAITLDQCPPYHPGCRCRLTGFHNE
ncbi:MAG: hypothetical protein L7F77_11425 [Candidatus Magnetominusculus sp. LBB02]|nr:hypothetical protein [Candidatus Magnetominusculus sp. LBB02]